MSQKEQPFMCSLPTCKREATMLLRVSTSHASEIYRFCEIHGTGLLEAQEDANID